MTLYITSLAQIAGVFEDNAKDYDRILRGVTNSAKRRELIAVRNTWREAAAFVSRHEFLCQPTAEEALRRHMEKKIG